MAFKKVTWFDRDSEYPSRRRLIKADGEGVPTSYLVDRDEGLVYEEGTELDAKTFNDLETRIASADSAQTSALNTQASTLNGRINTVDTRVTTVNSNLTSSINSVKATAEAALPKAGGTLTGELFTARRGIRWQNSPNSMWAFMGDGTLGGANFDFRCSGEGFLFRDMDGNELLPVYAANTVQPSTERFKNLQGDTARQDYQKLLKLSVKDYTYKEDMPFDSGVVHHGLIAEEVARYYPECVYKDRQGQIEGVVKAELVPLLIALAKDQQQDITEMKARLAKLEAKIGEVE